MPLSGSNLPAIRMVGFLAGAIGNKGRFDAIPFGDIATDADVAAS